ncbi:hypothetical protein [Enterobacter ludwigii]|uniref:hypothetical protein n=1 Tax=Enterobacter ludwigii TaxID=299767 RepID=UPI00397643A9
MKPEISQEMADKLIANASVNSQLFEKETGGMIIYCELTLKSGMIVHSISRDCPSVICLSELTKEKPSEEFIDALKILSDEMSRLVINESKGVLMGFRGYSFQRAMMGYWDL